MELRLGRRIDRRKGSAERMADERGLPPPVGSGDPSDAGADGLVRIMVETQRRSAFLRRDPFQKPDVQAMVEAGAHGAHRRGQVPKIGMLDRSRDDEERSAAFAAVVPQAPMRPGGDHAIGAFGRAEACRSEKIPLRPAHPIERARPCATPATDAVATPVPPFDPGLQPRGTRDGSNGSTKSSEPRRTRLTALRSR